MQLMLISDLALSPSHWAKADGIHMLSQKDMASRPEVTLSHNFIEIKLNKMKRQRSMFQMKEQGNNL